MIPRRLLLVTAATVTVALAACGGSDPDTADAVVPDAAQTNTAASTPALGDEQVGAADIRVVSPQEAAATIDAAPDDLVILDVRTQEEFDDAHIEGAIVLDFYRDDFAEQLATFDRDVPYVLYCRSGNRSSQARELMSELRFTSVDDVDGGIVGWVDAGLPVVSG